jgi:hypothetical protein
MPLSLQILQLWKTLLSFSQEREERASFDHLLCVSNPAEPLWAMSDVGQVLVMLLLKLLHCCHILGVSFISAAPPGLWDPED